VRARHSQAEGEDAANFFGRCIGRNVFGEDTDGVRVLEFIAGGAIAAHDVVVENGLELPAFLLCEVGEVFAAIEALLFAGNGDEDDGGGKFDFGEDAGAFEADGNAAGIVVGAGGFVVGVSVGAVAGIVMAGDKNHARGLRWVASAHHSVDVGEGRGLGDAGIGAGSGRLGERIAMDFEASITSGGEFFELGFDPVRGSGDASAWRQVFIQRRESAAIMERDEGGNRMLNLLGRDLGERVGDGGIGGHGTNGSADGIQIVEGGIA
jgi:hypothetical protein